MSESLNRMIAGRLDEAAETLRHEGADSLYVRAYTLAASSIRHWPISMAVMFEHRGVEGLEEVPGVGPRIAPVIRQMLTHPRLPPLEALRQKDETSVGDQPAREPSMEELLDVDREYREKAVAGALPLIAPQRFNPSGDRWLPVLHTHRGSRGYTALHSNTERAHRLGRSRDWVVIYARDTTGEHQYTVITSTHGPLRGHRVVAGHERQCRAAERRAA
jgi:DNA polymerase (family 10)